MKVECKITIIFLLRKSWFYFYKCFNALLHYGLKADFHALQLFTLFKQKKVSQKLRNFQEPTMRFELTTSSLPRKRSTPELRRQNLNKKITAAWCDFLERKTGVEPATFSLEGWRSTNWATSAFCFQKGW